MVDPTVFRDVLAQWPSGVTVVTTLAAPTDGSPEQTAPSWHGMTASSFSSVSLTPPLVSICLDRKLYSHGLISESGLFGISVLAKDQAEVARRFAGMVPDVEDRFAGESWSTAVTGVPLLDSALGWLDCRVVHEHEGGDHTIFVGEVLAGHTARKSAPLLFHSRGWGQFADVMPDVATLADTSLVDDHVAAAEIAGAGVRVRVAQPMLTVAGGTSIVVGDREQAMASLEAGVDVAEWLVDPLVPGDLDRVLSGIEGIADRSSVHLLDAFGASRADAVAGAVSAFAQERVLEICLQDRAGSATPLAIRHLLQEVVALARPVPIRLGLHDRDRLGLVKAITALKSGVSHFDTSATGADGAVSTEDLVCLLHEVDVTSPVDVVAVADLSRRLRAPLNPAEAEPASAPTAPPPAILREQLGAAG
ncbi:flavin reductase [Nocardioides sp.]|uniref:flavin reductase n=1 Tax=Nocardioides sp. TaxID=35761 RepID=UPI00356829E7